MESGTISYYSNGNKYDGGWKKGLRDGVGTFKYTNGDVYTGEWKNGNRTGEGTFKYANGDNYKGGYLYGKRHGNGTFNYSNGDKYFGSWKNGKRDGPGIFTYNNGEKLEGQWAQNKFLYEGDASNDNKIDNNIEINEEQSATLDSLNFKPQNLITNSPDSLNSIVPKNNNLTSPDTTNIELNDSLKTTPK